MSKAFLEARQRQGFPLLRWAIAGFSATLVGFAIYSGLRAFHLHPAIASPLAAAASVLAAMRLARLFPVSWDAPIPHVRSVFAAWTIAVSIALAQTIRLSLFMLHAYSGQHAILPFSKIMKEYSCISAYYEGARHAHEGAPNIYDEELYWGPKRLRPTFGVGPTDIRLMIGPFEVGKPQYPPPFFLLPRLIQVVTTDFFAARMLWFAVESLAAIAAFTCLCLWIGGTRGRTVALLFPGFWMAVPMLETLQTGNFQIIGLALSVLAMIAIQRGRNAIAGAALSFAILSKMFPGVLVIFLAAQRRWRSLLWILAFSAGWIALTIAVFGWTPFHAFLTFQLARLSDGTAFPYLERFPRIAAMNHSLYGMVLKLRYLGVPHMTTPLARMVSTVYSVAIVVLAIAAGRVQASKIKAASLWIALLHLGALRSPWCADVWALLPPLWLLMLLTADCAPARWWIIAAFGGAWVALNICLPPDIHLAKISFFALEGISQAVSLLVLVAVLSRTLRWSTNGVIPEPVGRW